MGPILSELKSKQNQGSLIGPSLCLFHSLIGKIMSKLYGIGFNYNQYSARPEHKAIYGFWKGILEKVGKYKTYTIQEEWLNFARFYEYVRRNYSLRQHILKGEGYFKLKGTGRHYASHTMEVFS